MFVASSTARYVPAASPIPPSTSRLRMQQTLQCRVKEKKGGKKPTAVHLIPSALEKMDHHQCRHSAHMLTFLLFNMTDTHRHASRISRRNNLNLPNNKTGFHLSRNLTQNSVVLPCKAHYRRLSRGAGTAEKAK